MSHRVRLPEALHARPANLLVRLAQRFEATLEVRKGEKRAIASRILEVLALGAAAGEEVEIVATGADAEAALLAVRELVQRGFSSDLVPETGSAVVEGIAIGRAILFAAQAPASADMPDAADRAAVLAAFARASAGLRALIGSLAPREAVLFEPELAILEDLRARVLSRVDAGEAPASAVDAETGVAPTDLILDARARLLDALASVDEAGPTFAELAEDAILVAEALTPSLVAALPPKIVGIVASADDADERPMGFTSHAAILARGRGLPLAFVPPHVAAQISDGEIVVLDTTSSPASVWASPSEDLVSRARQRRIERERAEVDAARASVTAPLQHRVALRVNVSSLAEALPEAAEGVGLLRTELLFAGRRSAPSEAEQHAAASTIAARVRGPVVARLFDAGGDKPLPWLPAPAANPDARGMDLLLAHREVLLTQVRALARANVRILLPLVRGARDVDEVRALAGEGAEIGAMIETPEAVEDVGAIARAADFVCVGTNDLSAAILRQAREVASLSSDPRLFQMVARVVEGARAHGRAVTVCGEIAGDPDSARVLVGLGVDALSVAPSRFAGVLRALARATREDCARAAREVI